MFSELQRQLASAGFRSIEKLAQLFKRVDFDSNGSLDFSEFLALLYLWAMNENADYSAFFRHPANADIIKQAFEAMEQCMIHYDKDGSRKLSIMEVAYKNLNILFELTHILLLYSCRMKHIFTPHHYPHRRGSSGHKNYSFNKHMRTHTCIHARNVSCMDAFKWILHARTQMHAWMHT